MNAIFHRTSVRQFTDAPVEEEKIEKLLRAAMASPTATNQQPWEFYVVTDRKVLDDLLTVSPYATPLKTAPMAIVVCYRNDCRLPEYGQIDCAIATENIWLEADELGLGAVMLGIAPEQDRMDALHTLFNMPDYLVPFTIIPVGYPVSVKPQEDRYDSNKVHRI